jgi:hypothetical protein
MAETKNEILNKIKVFLGLAEETSPAFTLADGTPIEVSALEVGGTVMIGGMVAPAGEYTLSDGQTLVVDETGLITALNALPTEMTGPPAEESAPPVSQATIEQMVKEAVTAAVGAQMEKYTAALAKQEGANKMLVGLMEEVLKTPTVEPEKPKQTFTKGQPESKNERFGRIAKTLETLKN